jgi:hypothetical protein
VSNKWGESGDYMMARRPSFSAKQLHGMGAALAVVAHAPVAWIMQTFACSEADARQFKHDASLDFFVITRDAKQTMGR